MFKNLSCLLRILNIYKPRLAEFFGVGLALVSLQVCLAESVVSQEINATTSQLTTQNNISADAGKLLQEGKAFYETERFSEALQSWRTAESVFAAKKEILNQALSLSFLSLAYQKMGDWKEAKKATESSLELLQNVGDSNRDKTQILAIALNTKGRLQLSLGQLEDALDNLQKATAAYTQAGDEVGVIGSTINVAETLQTLGFYRRSASTLLDLATRLQKQSDSPIKVMGLVSISNALRVSGDLGKSLEISQQSLAIAQGLRSKSEISLALVNLGNIQLALAKNAEDLAANSSVPAEDLQIKKQAALESYRQAASITNSTKTRVEAQLNQFSLLVETNQLSQAETLWPQIQSEINQLPPSRNTIVARINLAQNLMKLSAANRQSPQVIPDTAQILATAVRQAKSLGDKKAESFALGNLGELYERNKQLKNAEELTKPALILAQSINAPDIAYRWQWQLGRLLKAQGNIEGAIAAYTEAVNTLQSLRSDLATINPEVQYSFRDSVEPVYRQLVDLLLRSPDGSSRSQNRLIQARKTIESLQLAELDNFFREACLDAQPKQIDQIDRKAAVIYPVILPDRIEVILSLPQQPLRNYTVNIDQKQVENTIDKLRQALATRYSERKERLSLGEEIYNWSIRPLEAELKSSGVETLVFVLDGSLRNIPMATLYDGQQYLIEKYSIALTPGLQLLQPQPLTRLRLRALTGGMSEGYKDFAPLPAVTRELQQISIELGNTTSLLNQQFTSTTLEREVKTEPFPVVHLATHGQFSSNSQDTFILAWDGPINVKNLNELLRNRAEGVSGKPIELLVLSACETAKGDRRAALGLAGVAVRAGASSTLATLWKVSDDSTAALMSEFYRQLGVPGITKAEALRQAQISLLRNDKYRTPYFWAPYVLVGNWL